MSYELHCGDCLEVMESMLESASIDAIICDPPYGTTACRWDEIIPFVPMWECIARLIKPRSAVVVFGSQPFTSALIMSNPGWFKYCWVWEKSRKGDVMNAKNKPLKQHEDVIIFSKGTTANKSDRRMAYYPQGIVKNTYTIKNSYRHDGQSAFKPKRPSHQEYYTGEQTNYPTSILRFANGNHGSLHPTQKPVDLLAYLIRTYTNPGETVLDFCMGSGSTGVAAIQEGRRFIGIEKDAAYFEVAKQRIAAESTRLVQSQLIQELAHGLQ